MGLDDRPPGLMRKSTAQNVTLPVFYKKAIPLHHRSSRLSTHGISAEHHYSQL
ncbi:hypothetical protein J6590_068149, partial [Homalodisca vitripennis]